MKVAFYVYPTAFQSPGGGEVQLLKTKEYLEKLGVSVHLLNPWTDKLKDFDLLHTFGSVKDSLPMMEAAKHAGTPNVLSTICWYNWQSSWKTYSAWNQKMKGVLHHAAKEFFPWVPSARKKMMQVSDALLPNSKSEANQLKRYFGVPENRIHVIPNAVDASFAEANPSTFIEKFGFQDFVLCVGRIEPRKNQLNMVRAMKGSDATVVFVGDCVPHYKEYLAQCKREATSNIHFLGSLDHGSGLLASAYAAAHTYLLASWLETPGLAALEAGLARANIVITREGATQEYFSDYAHYVKPDDLKDIRDAVLKSLEQPKSDGLKQHILSHYSWENTAKQTLKVYEGILSNS